MHTQWSQPNKGPNYRSSGREASGAQHSQLHGSCNNPEISETTTYLAAHCPAARPKVSLLVFGCLHLSCNECKSCKCTNVHAVLYAGAKLRIGMMS
jgi:hypothetical protein